MTYAQTVSSNSTLVLASLKMWLILLVDATDSKGEPIHQTLMAKKMQRLDESPDFRPFKFRILAFTNAFLEKVSLYLDPLDCHSSDTV